MKKKAVRTNAKKAAPAKPEFTLVIRTCSKGMTSHGGFKWPESGPVEALDWDPTPVCGRGLHGLANGVGNYGLLSLQDPAAKWLVVKVRTDELVTIDRERVKFRRGEVVYCGAMAGALTRISECWREIARTQATGQHAAKDETHAAAQGDSGHAAAQGYYGHAAAQGDSGHAAAQGHYGTAVAGFDGRAKAAATGAFAIAWFDYKAKRARLIVGIPGEDGIKADTWYRVDDAGKLVEVPA